MYALRVITTFLDIAFMLILFFFSRNLSWFKKDDRFSIVGFGTMIALYVMNAVLIWR